MRIILAAPRGFCAGVNMAIESLERAVALYGTPLYVYHEIVHNRWVVEHFRGKGVVFVDSLEAVPEGSYLLFSAHGIAPQVRRQSEARRLKTIDATCPLVTKVHREAQAHHKRGRHVLLIGHRGHPEVVGTMGQLPAGAVALIQTAEEAETFVPRDPANLAFVTQTTLSLDEARDIIHALKIKFPNIVGPHSQDICYATENRQVAVRNVAHNAGLVLVVGSTNSSNSNRLVEVSRNLGTIGYLIDNSQAIDPKWLEGVSTVAVTAGASAPEVLVEDVVNYLRLNGFDSVEEVEVMPENVRFGLPPEIVQAIGSAGGAGAVAVR